MSGQEQEQQKRCCKCREEKPVSAFWKDRTTKDGLTARCRYCYNDYQRERRYPRVKTTAKYKAAHAAAQRRYTAKRPEVVSAHSKANKQVATADKCAQCGSTERLQKHHPDYSRPLYVITLCNPCHATEHHPRS